ncbi:hypothetical protein ACIHEI_17775 [Kitasatospora sp. NPDC051984]|uniref:hypothetical protein n=1 Tax=Kitasatospora sp. NPDC051984 TaxID=3364059 RepID=UPI0037C7D698
MRRHVWAGLAENPLLPVEAVDRLLVMREPDLSLELAERTDLTERQVVVLAERGVAVAGGPVESGQLAVERIDPVQQPVAALALLRAGLAPVEWAHVLGERAELREELAGCRALPREVARRLAGDSDPAVPLALAEETDDPEIAALLAAHPSQHVRAELGFNRDVPPAVLADLINDRPPLVSCDVCVRHAVPWVHPPDCPDPECTLPGGAACDGSHQYARHTILRTALGNPAAPVAEVMRYLDAPSPFLREQLASRTDLPASAYAVLAAAPEIWVREPLASNPAIGEELLRHLAEDPSVEVRRSAAQHPLLPLDVLGRLCATDWLGPLLLPRIAAATPAELDALAGSANPELRRLTALRRDLPAPVRDRLADDAVAKVAAAVAPHPGLGEGQLRAMHRRHGRAVGAGIAANPDASTALLAELVRADHNVATLRALADHPAADGPTLTACLRDRRARRKAAAHPALPLAQLLPLLDDSDPATVQGAAANPVLPVAEMLRLMPPDGVS